MQLYRRHTPTCPHVKKGAAYSRCNCPIYADGEIGNKRFRRSMQTRSWSEAEARLLTIQSSSTEQKSALFTPHVPAAIAAYIEELEFNKCAQGTIYGYKSLMGLFADAMGDTPLRDIDAEAINRYLRGKQGKQSKTMTTATIRKEVAILRAFFAYCIKRRWLTENPAKHVTKPAQPRFITKPFERREVDRMVAAAEKIPGPVGLETRAALYTLLYTGLRIGDVAQLKRSAYNRKTGYLTLPWTQKTGTPVRLKLNPAALSALDAMPHKDEYWFHFDGNTQQWSRTRRLRRRIVDLGRSVGVEARPHRFRDTFAVELLTNGAGLRTVQHLLGHDSIETTEKHYAHFVAEHQSMLDRATATLEFGNAAARPIAINAHHD